MLSCAFDVGFSAFVLVPLRHWFKIAPCSISSMPTSVSFQLELLLSWCVSTLFFLNLVSFASSSSGVCWFFLLAVGSLGRVLVADRACGSHHLYASALVGLDVASAARLHCSHDWTAFVRQRYSTGPGYCADHLFVLLDQPSDASIFFHGWIDSPLFGAA